MPEKFFFASSVGGRSTAADQESAVAGSGHAQSVCAAGGSGSLHHDPDPEPERDWIHLWSHCKHFIL